MIDASSGGSEAERSLPPPTPPGRRPPPPERWDPPPIDRRNDDGRGGGGGESSDRNDVDARDRRRRVVHLAVGAGGRRRQRRHDGRHRTTTAKTMETIRDDAHEEDVVPRSRSETLCEGGASGDASRPSLPPAAAGRRRTTRLALRGRCHCRRPRVLLRGTWRGRRRRRNGGYICDDNINDYIQRRDVRNRITI